MNKTLIQAAFFFFLFVYEWPHQLFQSACSCLVGLTFEMIASNREQTSFLPVGINAATLANPLSLPMQIRTQGRPRCPFAGLFFHLPPTSCREPRSQKNPAVLRLLNTDGCWASEICPCQRMLVNKSVSIYLQVTCHVSCLSLLKVAEEVGFYLPTDFQFSLYSWCLSWGTCSSLSALWSELMLKESTQ